MALSDYNTISEYDEAREDYPEDWGKAVYGHVEHWTEQRRIEEHFGQVQEEKLEGELING